MINSHIKLEAGIFYLFNLNKYEKEDTSAMAIITIPFSGIVLLSYQP